MNFWSADNLLKASAVVTVLFSSFVKPSAVTQPRNVLPSAVGFSANESPVPSATFAPVNPFAT